MGDRGTVDYSQVPEGATITVDNLKKYLVANGYVTSNKVFSGCFVKSNLIYAEGEDGNEHKSRINNTSEFERGDYISIVAFDEVYTALIAAVPKYRDAEVARLQAERSHIDAQLLKLQGLSKQEEWEIRCLSI